jgi:hypothetical protein
MRPCTTASTGMTFSYVGMDVGGCADTAAELI